MSRGGIFVKRASDEKYFCTVCCPNEGETATVGVLLLLYYGTVEIAGWPPDLFDFVTTVLPTENLGNLEPQA